MKLPYGLQQLYIKMLSNSFTDHQINQRRDNIIEIVYTTPDGKLYESDFAINPEGVMISINTCLGDA